MSVTAQEIFNITMAFADEIDDTGAINPTNTASYRVRTLGILNTLQAELLKQGDIYKTHEISNKPIENMFGFMNGFDVVEFIGEEIVKECNGSVKAYYFEVDGEGTVFIEDYTNGWNTLATININSTVTDFTAFKGVVTPTTGATKSRIRFTGPYRYLITNYAMFNVPLASSKVPDYRPWIKKTMPSDFKAIDKIILEHPQRVYERDEAYKFEGRNEMYINYYYEGSIRIVYRPIPVVLAALTDVLSVDDITARTLLPYGLGMELFKEENEDIYRHFFQRYNELKSISMVRQPASFEKITNVYEF